MRPAMVTILNQPDGTMTYRIDDPDSSGYAEVSIEALVGLLEMAGIRPEAR